MVGVVLLGGIIMSAGSAGCQNMAEVERFRSEAVQFRDTLQQEASAWERRLAQIPPGHPLAGEAETSLARMRAKLAAVESAIREADLVIEEATNPTDTLTRTVSTVAPLLPEPARVPLLLGAACIVALARAAQLKRAAASVARGIEKAMEDDPQFRSAFRRHANTFRTVQTGAARRIVDETTSDSFMIRLPV
jgi:hypothetical protein